jgi:hypothetical protein
MAVPGMGGFFFHARDPEALSAPDRPLTDLRTANVTVIT